MARSERPVGWVIVDLNEKGKVVDLSGVLVTQGGALAMLRAMRASGSPGAWVAESVDRLRSKIDTTNWRE